MNAVIQPAERPGPTSAEPYWASGNSHHYSQIASQLIGSEARHRMISEAAYFHAQRRGFNPGHELDDWLAAENEIDTSLTIGLPL